MSVIIYDFDGVLVDSVEIKRRAFFNIFKPFGLEVSSKVYNYHIEDNRNRFLTIKYGQEILGYNDDFYNEMLDKFKRSVVNEVILSTEIPGALDFIKKMSKKGNTQFVMSGTPQGELEQIIKAREWDPYFLGVYGTPTKKEDHIEHVLKHYNIDNRDIIFFGDMMSDYRAAKKFSIPFVARSFNGFFEIENVKTIIDFVNLDFEKVKNEAT